MDVPESIKRKVVGGVVAPLQIGSWISVFLWAYEIQYGIQYLCRSYGTREARILKLLVAVVFINNFVSTIIGLYGVHSYTIDHWGNFSYVRTSHWFVGVNTAASGVAGAVPIFRGAGWKLNHL
ncbi:hypothetical protein BT69DRAFT_1296113 [Atractiella rhizophila]|nr:hypothetical protein BT69DRAFT_1296113 [Atractiella rhizophila]